MSKPLLIFISIEIISCSVFRETVSESNIVVFQCVSSRLEHSNLPAFHKLTDQTHFSKKYARSLLSLASEYNRLPGILPGRLCPWGLAPGDYLAGNEERRLSPLFKWYPLFGYLMSSNIFAVCAIIKSYNSVTDKIVVVSNQDKI